MDRPMTSPRDQCRPKTAQHHRPKTSQYYRPGTAQYYGSDDRPTTSPHDGQRRSETPRHRPKTAQYYRPETPPPHRPETPSSRLQVFKSSSSSHRPETSESCESSGSRRHEEAKDDVIATPSQLLRDMIRKQSNITEELQEMMRRNEENKVKVEVEAEVEPEPVVLTPSLLKGMMTGQCYKEDKCEEEAIEVLLSPDMLMELIQMTTEEKKAPQPTLLTTEAFMEMLHEEEEEKPEPEPEEKFELTGDMIMELIKKICGGPESEVAETCSNVSSLESVKKIPSEKLSGNTLLKLIMKAAGIKEEKRPVVSNCPTCCQVLPPQTCVDNKNKSTVDGENFSPDTIMNMIHKATAVQEVQPHKVKRKSSRKTCKPIEVVCEKEPDSVELTAGVIMEMIKKVTFKPPKKYQMKTTQLAIKKSIGLGTEELPEEVVERPVEEVFCEVGCSESSECEDEEVITKESSDSTLDSRKESVSRLTQESVSRRNQDSKSRRNQDSVSRSNQDSKSRSNQDSKYRSNQDSKSRSNQDSKSRGNQDSKSRGNQDSKSRRTQDSKSRRTQDSKSLRQDYTSRRVYAMTLRHDSMSRGTRDSMSRGRQSGSQINPAESARCSDSNPRTSVSLCRNPVKNRPKTSGSGRYQKY